MSAYEKSTKIFGKSLRMNKSPIPNMLRCKIKIHSTYRHK